MNIKSMRNVHNHMTSWFLNDEGYMIHELRDRVEKILCTRKWYSRLYNTDNAKYHLIAGAIAIDIYTSHTSVNIDEEQFFLDECEELELPATAVKAIIDMI